MKKHNVVVNPFVRRQTPDSPFSHFEGSTPYPWEELADLVEANLEQAKLGYRIGVLCVPVPPGGFYSGVVTLTEGCEMQAAFVPRRPGEEPRMQITAKGEKLPAKSVEVILYASTLLAEDGDNVAEDAWEIISINASPTKEATPLTPQALMANHFGADGGTDTKMTAEQFESALRESFLFWKDKAMCST